MQDRFLDTRSVYEIARGYAEALYNKAKDDFTHGPAEWLVALKQMAEFTANKQVRGIIESPDISPQELNEFVADIMRRSNASAEQRAFILNVTGNGHLTLMPQIRDAFSEIKDRAENVFDVRIRSARKMDEQQIDGMKGMLRERFGVRAKVIDVSHEPALIEGFVVHFGGRMIDQSAQGYRNRKAA